MKQTYTGGCHCGAVRYEADIDFSQGTVKCNCSICSKARAWLVGVSGEDFRLQSGADALGDYQFAAQRIHHLFCKQCGVKSFARATGPDGKPMVAVMVSCLDGLSDAERASLPVVYIDGRHDDFKSPPAETRYL
jgi:hypothetical protein